MTEAYVLVAAAYLLFGCGVWWYEARRVRRRSVDAISVFVILLLLQTCIAAVAIFGFLPYVDPASPTGNPVFDRIFQTADLSMAWMVFFLTAWFTVWFYIGCGVMRILLPARAPGRPLLQLRVHDWRLALVLVTGVMMVLYSFTTLGDSLFSRYANLILYRGDLTDSLPRTALNATAFSLTQTWSWLSVAALFLLLERRGWRGSKLLVIAMMLLFAIMGVSRRALIFPLLFCYLGSVLYTGRWRVKSIMVCTVPVIFWLAFGKELLASMAFGVPVESVAGSYGSLQSGLLRAASELGITVVESLGTLTFLPHELRFGVDHVMSVAQRFPEGILGIDINWPDRMVRISTEAFAGRDALDVPPGFAGQMWLDFRIFGPVVWGLIMGLQVGILQWFFERTQRTLGAAAMTVLATFVISMPINSGSFDFTLSIEIIVFVVAVWWCFSLKRPTAHRPVGQSSTARPAAVSTEGIAP